MAGTLVVIATPIGNLGDLSPRAAEALRTVDLVLAEDTRRTGRLLAHVGSRVRQRSLHEHNEQDRTEEVLRQLREGARVALVSDAGTPAVSDPGYRLLAACAAAGVRIEPVPGPSAALAALVVSGLPTDRVAFEGFLPRRNAARRQRLAELAGEPRTVVLFLAPHRAATELTELAEHLGGARPAVLARELTKLHEEVIRGSLAELAERAANGLKGELALVVGGAAAMPAEEAPELGAEELATRVRGLIATGVTKKAAISQVAEAARVPKREVYQAVVDVPA